MKRLHTLLHRQSAETNIAHHRRLSTQLGSLASASPQLPNKPQMSADTSVMSTLTSASLAADHAVIVQVLSGTSTYGMYFTLCAISSPCEPIKPALSPASYTDSLPSQPDYDALVTKTAAYHTLPTLVVQVIFTLNTTHKLDIKPGMYVQINAPWQMIDLGNFLCHLLVINVSQYLLLPLKVHFVHTCMVFALEFSTFAMVLYACLLLCVQMAILVRW